MAKVKVFICFTSCFGGPRGITEATTPATAGIIAEGSII